MSEEKECNCAPDGYCLFEVWKEYEGIAMHFNELILKVRVQALGGVAAISTLVTFFSEAGDKALIGWGVVTAVFFFLILFWIAIWVLDFRYYNRLLLGAVEAIVELEEMSQTTTRITELNLSKKVEDCFYTSKERPNAAHLAQQWRGRRPGGRAPFYRVVLIALITGFLVSLALFFQDWLLLG
jgi:hypothetical protein